MTTAVELSTRRRTNNLVAESDLESAIGAIQATLAEKANTTNHAITRQLLCDLSTHMVAHLQRTVQPIGDDAFVEYVSRYTDSRNYDSKDPIPDDFVFDEDELVDRAAEARVKELRHKVRAQAGRIQSLQGDCLDRAMALTERHVQSYQASLEDTETLSGGTVEGSTALEAMPEHQAAVNDMKVSLDRMRDTVEEVNKVLPNKLKVFQETLLEIETSLSKAATTANNGGVSASQIERAIHHREPEMAEDDTDTTLEIQAMHPEQLLADMLC